MDNYNNSIEHRIDISLVLHNVLRHKTVILLLACFTAMAAFIVGNITYKPIYRTSSTLIITDSRASRNVMTNLQTTNQLAGVLSTIFDSHELQEIVYEDLGYKSLPGRINTNLVPETNFFIFSVDAESPKLSYDMFLKINEVYPMFTSTVIANAIITVFDPPVVPEHPINSNNAVRYAFLAFFGGIGLAIIVMGLYSYFRDTVKNVADIKVDFGIPFSPEIPLERGSRTDRRRGISIIDINRSEDFIESYRGLRTMIETARVHDGVTSILVTSSVAGEGKTSVAANLALSLAQIGKHVLLLDCNFYNPSVSVFFGADIPENAQLSGYLSDQSGSNKIIRKFRELPLYIAANRNPASGSSEMIVSKQMESLLSQAKQRYDYVIIDSPALSENTDAYELADLVDASLLVIRQDYAKINMIKNSIRLLTSVGTFLGSVFNFSERPIIRSGDDYTAGSSQPASSERRAKHAK